MAIEDRRARERAARHQLIVTTARQLAEAEGWDAVTTRRLATEIEYSQPVLYAHFANMDQLVQAVAIEGFTELNARLRTARTEASNPADALARLAHAYVAFARDNPAVYDAMFTRTTTLAFAADDTPPELKTGFAELRGVITAVVDDPDPDTLTEVFWSALHGLVTLARAGRLRPDHDIDRIRLLLAHLAHLAQRSE